MERGVLREKNSVSPSLNRQTVEDISSVLDHLVARHNISYNYLNLMVKNKIKEQASVSLPASLLRAKVSTSEVLVTYLHDHKKISLSRISQLLKLKHSFVIKKYRKNALPAIDDNSVQIPVQVFSKKANSHLENIVEYLKENKQLRNCEIARILGRDDKTIWTAYNRAKEKQNKGGNI